MEAPVWSLFLLALLAGWAGAPCAVASPSHPSHAAIASAHPLATEAGFEVLEAGGNAFDAAVAVSAALAVVEPYSSGLGGGGFWLLHRSRDGREVMVDGRERAPGAARADLFLDESGRFVPERSLDGPLAAGIPGEPAALVHLAAHYGRLPLERTLAPAVRLAREGFPVDPTFRRMAERRQSILLRWSASAAQFLQKGVPPDEGAILRQPDLAATLKRLAEGGHAGFYSGETARRLVEGVRAAGGIWTLDDLAQYQVVERNPITGSYRGLRITSAAPPSSGGVVLVQMLNMLQGRDLNRIDSVGRVHLLAEVMRRAYRDRAEYLGDPDFVAMPLDRLLHPYYAEGLMRDFAMERATPSLPVGESTSRRGADTSHFSILDREGNRVAATLSINFPFGSGFVPPGTGVVLNDEMDDFSALPGAPNLYGLVGGRANAIAPGKRMLSSMAPTFVETEGGVAILGTPGGSRIITMVLHAVLAVSDGAEPEEWVAMPRFHHQFLPDEIQYEPGAVTAPVLAGLEQRGHRMREIADGFGNMQAVFWDKATGRVLAASDPRGSGRAAAR
jgi:gamma-glutamyltranspeptidase/glutathione hydrolase